MKQIFLIFLIHFGSIFCFGKFAFAQGSFLGGVAGGSLSKISSNSELIKANSKVFGLFGVSFGYEFKNSLFISTSAIYLPRGYRLSSYITISLNEMSTEMITMDYSTNYFAQPTKLGYLFGNKIIGFFSIGLVPSVLISSNRYTPIFFGSNGTMVPPTTTNTFDLYNKFDFAGLGEFGGGIKFNKHWSLLASLSYSQSFNSILKSDVYNGLMFYFKNISFQLELRYSFNQGRIKQRKNGVLK